MKAIRKSDGKTIDVTLYHDKEYICKSEGRTVLYESSALIVSDYDYWSKFLRDVAKEMLPVTAGWKLTKGDACVPVSKEAAAKLAIEYADELIKQLHNEMDFY